MTSVLHGRLRTVCPERAACTDALLDGLARVARGHVPGAHEGPGALVDRQTWTQAVRALADTLLLPAAGEDGTVLLGLLTPTRAETFALLFPEPAAVPVVGAPRRQQPSTAWDGTLVVVVGCGRSGTTWLERMLMASPETGGVDGAESFLFEQVAPLWEQRERLAPLVDAEQLVAALRTFCDTILTAALQRHSPGARVFVEKTPLHSFHLPMIGTLYPEAHYLHLVRDGRDVSRSISQVDFFGLPDPADAVRMWRRVLEVVRAHAPGLRRFRELRYEDLLTDPVAQVAELLTWLGVDVDDAVRAELATRAAARVSTHAGLAQTVGTGTWQALPRTALARVYAEAGRALVTEGYASPRELHRARLLPSYWRRRLAIVRRERLPARPRLL